MRSTRVLYDVIVTSLESKGKAMVYNESQMFKLSNILFFITICGEVSVDDGSSVRSSETPLVLGVRFQCLFGT